MQIEGVTRNELARRIQEHVPLVPRPWKALGDRLGVPEGAVMDQLRAWLEEGTLREISAILEGRLLGYDSALVAGKVPPGRIAEVAAVVNAHPTVTHNYVREHDYNLWFTIAVPRSSGLERTLEVLAGLARVDAFLPLRRTHTFKVGVNFDLRTRRNRTAPAAGIPGPGSLPLVLTERTQRMLRALQRPLEIVRRPYLRPAEEAGVEEGELLEFAQRHLGGVIRRHVATFRHRRLGVHGNAMSVWEVPEAEIESAGRRLAACPEVSHCYARNAIPGFPYRLYGMLHGPDRASCERLAEKLAPRVGAKDFLLLHSTAELKKCRLRYFLPELSAWEERHGVRRAEPQPVTGHLRSATGRS